MTNAQKIKEARTALGMSQGELAKALGLLRPQTVSDWELGKRQPKEYVWLALQSLRNTKQLKGK
jgi:DNA-binding transcriptional regulator YiaG